MNLLKDGWWATSPIDFEHKKWLFLDYLQKLEKNIFNKKFYPNLSHAEDLLEDMEYSLESILETEISLKKEYLTQERGVLKKKTKTPQLKELNTFKEILEYCIPLLHVKVDLGKKIYNDHPNFIYGKTRA